jgi:hypothetical protein
MQVIPTVVAKINTITWKFSQTCTPCKMQYSSALVFGVGDEKRAAWRNCALKV